MPLIDNQEQSVAAGANMIRREARRGVMQMRRCVLSINAIVAEHGRSALAAELGDDAAELLTFYNNATSLVETATGNALPELPA